MNLALFLAAALAGSCPEQEAVLQGAADAIERTYLSAQEGQEIAASVRYWAKTGRYAGACGDWRDFSDRLNRDLDAYDGHFHVEQAVDEAAGQEEDWLMAWRAAGKPSNMGVREVKVLEGNIGYVRLASFYPWETAKPKILSAMALVNDTEGLVLDLRQNGGGDAETANHLMRAFMADDTSSIQQVSDRNGSRAELLPEREIPEYRGAVVVLVDRRSASAAEYVAYSLQAAERATVVGSRSAGAATMIGDPQPLPHSFQIFIPDSQPLNIATQENWGRTGVVPDAGGGDDPVFVARRILNGDLKTSDPHR